MGAMTRNQIDVAGRLFFDLFPDNAEVIDGDHPKMEKIFDAFSAVMKEQSTGYLEIQRRMGDQVKMAEASEARLARMAGEYERLYVEILGPSLTRCRMAQDAEHGGPTHDDTHTPAEWAEFIRKFAGRAEYQGQFQDNVEAVARYQAAMIDVAGLAISAVLSSQRKVRGESV
jgi:hypothetical protein